MSATPHPARSIQLATMMLVVSLGAAVRLLNLNTTPGLYSDEGTLLDIAHHLLLGKWQYMAITQSTLIAARPALFPLLLAGLSRLFGEGIVTLRVTSGLLGVISIILVYRLGLELLGPGGHAAALLSALAYALHPHAIAYSRLGFSYNLLGPLLLIICLLTWRYLDHGRQRNLIAAGLLVGLGTTSDLAMLTTLLPLLVICSSRGLRAVLGVLLGVLIPLVLYVGYMLTTAPDAFLYDLWFTTTRLSSIPALLQFPLAVLNFAGLFSWDPWFIPAIIGLFVVTPTRARWFLILFFTLPLLVIARTVAGLPFRAYYYLVPLLPLAAIGTGTIVRRGIPIVVGTFRTGIDALMRRWQWAPRSRVATWIQARVVHLVPALGVFFFIVSPYLISGLLTFVDVFSEMDTPIPDLLVEQADARAAVEYLNAKVGPSDLVLASPALGWMLDAQVADFQQSLAFEGKETIHYPAGMPRDRFAYPASPGSARYVVIDPVWRNWGAVVMPEVADLIRAVEAWPLVFKAGEIDVYSNPDFPSRSASPPG